MDKEETKRENIKNEPPLSKEVTSENKAKSDASKTDTSRHLDPFAYGFGNGILRIESPEFEHWITATETKKLVSTKLNAVREKIDAATIEYARCFNRYLELKKIYNGSVQEIAENNRKIQNLQTKIEEEKALLPRIESKEQSIRPPYNWFMAFLYLFVGIVFITVDISVMKVVGTNIMNLGYIDALLLAIGIASVAFIIKPAVDRIFERPYSQGKKIKRNHSFLAIVALIAALALGLMGNFRFQGNKYEEIRKENTQSVQGFIIDELLEGKTTSGIEEQTIDDGLIEIISSPSLQWFFILSSILFAVAGAICFSIGFSSLNILLSRSRIRKLLKKCKSAIEDAESQIDGLYIKIKDDKIKIENTVAETEAMPELSSIKEKLYALEAKEELELQNFYNEQIKQRHYRYLDGREKGLRYNLTGQLLISPNAMERSHLNVPHVRSNVYSPKNRNGQMSTKNKIRRGGYLHERLREELGNNFGKLKQEINHLNGH